MHVRPVARASSDRLTLTVAEAAELLGISRGLAYELAARGELPVLRLGRRIVIPRKALEALVEAAGRSTGGTGEAGPPWR
ncbi:MAG: helix-turn-helix domain-containing protein [Actinobacteria bacterium]|nr:MAG: helix-turn-helix domain-containing protein [Actinomycetota bacterium]